MESSESPEEETEEAEQKAEVIGEEPDALLSQRCKLFYRRDGTYVEKGIGTLHLKQLGEKKAQLLVRYRTYKKIDSPGD
jgi:nuclear pore complex protein Nup50